MRVGLMESWPLRSGGDSPSPLALQDRPGGTWACSKVLLSCADWVGWTKRLARASVGSWPHLEPSPVGTLDERGTKKAPQGLSPALRLLAMSTAGAQVARHAQGPGMCPTTGDCEAPRHPQPAARPGA